MPMPQRARNVLAPDTGCDLCCCWQDAAEGNHEKLLLKLATKGVVKLFNVIQQQQKIRNEEKGREKKEDQDS